MNLDNEFVVTAPITRVWALLDDIPTVIRCVPGATFLDRKGDDFEVGIKIKVGPIMMNLVGAGRIVERDEAARRVVIHGSGKDSTGKGSANATVVATLTALDAERTHVSLRTDLNMSGKIAQFGGSVIADIASRLIAQFSANLHATLLDPAPVNMSAVPPPTIDAAGPAVAADIAQTNVEFSREAAPIDIGAAIAPIVRGYAFRLLFAVALFALGFAVGRYL